MSDEMIETPPPRKMRRDRSRSRSRSRSQTLEDINPMMIEESPYKKNKPTDKQQFMQWMVTFVGFFVLAILVAVIVGWLQEKSGYQPQNLSSLLMYALLFSGIGTILLNVGVRIFMPKAKGPALFVVI